MLFFVWIILNVGALAHPPLGGWDPFPFGLLTMVVSLEAIILSVFVLLSQNRQAARERVRNDIEYQINLKAELENRAHAREGRRHAGGDPFAPREDGAGPYEVGAALSASRRTLRSPCP